MTFSFFSRSSPLNSQEYETLYKHIIDLRANIKIVELELEKQNARLQSLNGKIAQAKQAEKPTSEEKAEDSNTQFDPLYL